MSRHRNFLAFVTLAMAVTTPCLAQTATGVVEPASNETNGTASIPDFSRVWNHPAFPWFEPPASGPGPITNLSRWAEQRPSGAAGSAAMPASDHGVSNYDQLVGDYKNPILQPWAAEVVKKFGEKALAGITTPNPSNQCWPEPTPFIYKQFLVQIIQQPDKITFLYNGNMDVRRVRLNQRHQEPPTPSLYGDSVGHYEGDTLVIDTIGVRTDRKYAMIDLFGTPYTKSLHIVERYRLRDYDDVKDAIERNKKENWLFNGDVFSGHRGIQLTRVEVAAMITSSSNGCLIWGGGHGVETENPLDCKYEQGLGRDLVCQTRAGDRRDCRLHSHILDALSRYD
jgi:hypothetical protein